jgi:hypothetical protein
MAKLDEFVRGQGASSGSPGLISERATRSAEKRRLMRSKTFPVSFLLSMRRRHFESGKPQSRQ